LNLPCALQHCGMKTSGYIPAAAAGGNGAAEVAKCGE